MIYTEKFAMKKASSNTSDPIVTLLFNLVFPFMEFMFPHIPVCQLWRKLMCLKTTDLVFLPYSPASVIRSALGYRVQLGITLKYITFKKCSDLDDLLLAQIIASVNFHHLILIRCDNLTVRPQNSQVLLRRGPFPRFLTPGCWSFYHSNQLSDMSPESIVEIQMNCFKYAEEAVAKIRFFSFCSRNARPMYNAMKENKVLPVRNHEIIHHQFLTNHNVVKVKIYNRFFLRFFLERVCTTNVWKIHGLCICSDQDQVLVNVQ